MSRDFERHLTALRQSVEQLTQTRYPDQDAGRALASAAQQEDTAYLLARAQLAEAECEAARLRLTWMAPTATAPPKEALARIKAVCGYWPDLYDAVQAVLATHPSVARDLLAQAIRQCRPDAAAYSSEDLTGMLIAAWNGGRQGFEAVLRTRKNNERKLSSGGFPWGSP